MESNPDLTLTPATLSDADPYRRALRALRAGLLATAGISAMISVLMLTGSIYMLQVYDRVLASGSVPTLVGLFVIVVVLYSFLGFYDFLRARMLSRLALQLDGHLGAAAFRGWLGSGKGQPLRDLDNLRGFVSGPAMSGMFDLPWVPLYLGVLFMIHPWLGWLTIAGSGIVAGLAWLGHRLAHGAMIRSLTDDATARDFAERCQRNAEMIHAMGMMDQIGRHWRRLQETALFATQQAGNPGEYIGAISRAFRMLMQSAILTLGAYLVIQGQMSGGMIIASSILTGRALGPVDQVIAQWRSISKAMESHRRLALFFAATPALAPPMTLPAPTGRISVSHLVKYAPDSRATALSADRRRLLDDISFDLAPGDGLGVIGASASGKSTLARLLAGAWGSDAGEIRLDGATRDQWDAGVLGRHIGYLPQQVDLLPGTLRDNIARFDPTATDHDVIEAATLAGVHEMILHLPDGYAARVGGPGEGANLSGGQVQRIGLARAMCGRPALVILDEPNSNLDAAGETCLTAAITALRARGAVVIVMAHRPNVLLATNKLLILDRGRVVEFGLRDDLIAVPVPPQTPGLKSSLTPDLAKPRTPVAPVPADVLTGAPASVAASGAASVAAGPAPQPAANSPASPSPANASDGPVRQRPPGAAPDMMRRARLFSPANHAAVTQRIKG